MTNTIAWRQGSPTKAPIMEIRVLVEPVQLPSGRDRSTQTIVTNVQELQLRQTGQRGWNAPIDLVMAHINRNQTRIELEISHVELQQIPRQIDLL